LKEYNIGVTLCTVCLKEEKSDVLCLSIKCANVVCSKDHFTAIYYKLKIEGIVKEKFGQLDVLESVFGLVRLKRGVL
jgi:hypothetical protein